MALKSHPSSTRSGGETRRFFVQTPPWLCGDFHANGRFQLACTRGELKFEYAGDLRAELLNKAELGSPLQGADLSSVLHHLEHVCERTNEKPFAMLIR